MVKKKINFLFIIISALIVLFIAGAIKTLNNHHEKEYLVVNSKILQKAKECYLKGDCTGEITLKDLYDKKYLDIQIDPVTKENMNDNTCIKYENDEALFC